MFYRTSERKNERPGKNLSVSIGGKYRKQEINQRDKRPFLS